MTLSDLIHSSSTVLVTSAWAAAGLFIARFMLTRWYRRSAGVLVMSFIGTVFLVLTLAVLSQIFGQNFPGRSYLRVGVYLVANVLLWRCVYLLFRDQRRARKEDRTNV